MVVGRWILGGILALSFGCSSTDGTNANAAVPHLCSPLEPTTSNVTLDASSILAAGRSADGTVYVVTQTNSKLRLFVSDGEGEPQAIVEQPLAGTGEEHTGASTTWLLDYVAADGSAVSVEVVQDATSLRIGVLKGPKAGKTWDLEQGELLTALPASGAAALPATSTQRFVVDYEGTHSDGRAIVVVAPAQIGSYEDFRLFWGTASDLRERVITSFSRARSIGGPSIVTFESESGSATLSYSFEYPIPQTGGMSQGSLVIDGQTDSLSGAAPPAVPDGAQFWCR